MTFNLTKMHSWTKNNLEFLIFLSLPIFFILGNFFLNLSISIICLLFLIKIYNIKIIYKEEKKIILSIFIFITSLIISFIFSEYNFNAPSLLIIGLFVNLLTLLWKSAISNTWSVLLICVLPDIFTKS
jgi:predicted ABC-type exoprotein transport system permease subunit